MHAFAQRQRPAQQHSSPAGQPAQQSASARRAVTVSPRATVEYGEASPDAPALSLSAHDFSRIPVYSHAPALIQPKLMVNAPEDIYEQEADRVSAQVLGMPEPKLRRACACGGSCAGCQKEQPAGRAHEPLQARHVASGGSEQAAAPLVVHEALASPGRPLDGATRSFMEPRFGHDFSGVRVHTDERAARSATAVGAHAYTVGNEIVFSPGHADFNSTEGRRLLAHELTHVLQQTTGRARSALSRQAASGGLLQRKDAPKDEPKGEQTAKPKASKCHKGCAGHWGQETTCSLWGFVSDVRDYGGPKWRGINPPGDFCCNTWPFAVEQYAIDVLGLDGAASCYSGHAREVATVTVAGKEPVKVLCSDTICGDPKKCRTTFGETDDAKACWNGSFTQEVIELSPKAMKTLSGNARTTPPVSVCYSGSKEGLCLHDGPGPKSGHNPEAADCLTGGCTPKKDTPKLKDTGWPPS